MLDPKLIDDLAQRLHSAVPDSVRTLQQDVDRNVRAAVQAALGRLDLVPREEFEVQSKVLARTRAQLDAMTRRVEALEEQLLGKRPAAAKSGNDSDMNGG